MDLEIVNLYPENLVNDITLTDEQWVTICKIVYQMTSVQEDDDGTVYLRINFLENMNQQHLQSLRTAAQAFAGATKTVKWLHKLLVTTAGQRISRRDPLINQIITNMNKQQINTQVTQMFANNQDDAENPQLGYTLFYERFLPKALDVLETYFRKECWAIKFYYLSKHIDFDIKCLEEGYQYMLATLTQRDTLKSLSKHIGTLRIQASHALVEYATAGSKDAMQDLRVIRTPTLVNEYDYNTFCGWITGKTIGTNILYTEQICPTLNEPFKTWTDSLGATIRGIHSFSPDPLDRAYQNLATLKPEFVSLIEEIETFLSSENRSLATAERLFSEMKGTEKILNNLKGQGAIVNLDTSGISREVWNDLYENLSNVISEYKTQAKKAELVLSSSIGQSNRNAPALKLVELKGIATWLEWKRSWNEVQDIYTCNATKKAVILASLHDKLDFQSCKSLDLPDILKYLDSKYNDPGLVTALLDKLLCMKPPTNDRQVYNNLTEFRNTYRLITYHKCEERVDRNFRQRLTPLLFSREHMLTFMREVFEFEDKLKTDNNISDDLSDIEGTVAAEIEDKRRTFWFNKIEKTYAFIRRLVIIFKSQDLSANQLNIADTDPADIN